MHFIIREGKNHAGLRPALVMYSRLRFQFMLEENCRYVPEAERDWNKLIGYSCSLRPFRRYAGDPYVLGGLETEWRFPHHRDSLRIGWRNLLPASEQASSFNWMRSREYELSLYLYENRMRLVIPIRGETFEWGRWYEGELDIANGRLRAAFAPRQQPLQQLLSLPTSLQVPLLTYRLNPYYGGYNAMLGKDTPCPHRMDFHVNFL